MNRLLPSLRSAHRRIKPARPGAKPASRPWQPSLETLEERTQLSVVAGPVAPVYLATFGDAVTGDNAFTATDGNRYWTVDPGADSYQNDVYERPTVQNYQLRTLADGTVQFATPEYFGNLDIVQAKAGFDDNYLYVALDLHSLDKQTADGVNTQQGLVYRYGFRISKEADGGHGLLLVADQPQLKNSPNTSFGQTGLFGYLDANGDVGGTGLSVSKQDRRAEVRGNGYETVVIADGRTAAGASVFWVRIDPNDPTVVEFALDYKAFGFSAADFSTLPYLHFEANKGLQDPGNYLWNDEYTQSEAGSPYRAASGDRSKSEFGTQGLGNIYELDTLGGGALVRLPSSLAGFVYHDADNDGVKDVGEDGLAGVFVTLIGTDDLGNPVQMTVITNDDGSYRFADLRPGAYALSETQPEGVRDGQDTIGTQGGSTENDRFFDIFLPAGVDGTDNNFGELDLLAGS